MFLFCELRVGHAEQRLQVRGRASHEARDAAHGAWRDELGMEAGRGGRRAAGARDRVRVPVGLGRRESQHLGGMRRERPRF